MSAAIQSRLRSFALALLERRGAVVDWPEDAEHGTALLPASLAATLGVGEYTALGPTADADGLAVNLATDFLDRAGEVLAGEPRVGAFRTGDLYLKQSGLVELVDRSYTWTNARVRPLATMRTRVECQQWHFAATVSSDDRFEDLFHVSVNTASRLPLELGDFLSGSLPLAPWPMAGAMPDLAAVAQAEARRRLVGRCRPFVERMETRLDRDRRRLKDYYAALIKDENAPLRGRRLITADLDKRAAKVRAVEVERTRKLVELDERYRLRLRLAPVALLRVEVPMLALQCEVQRRQTKAVHTLYWNPLVAGLEPLACAGCGAAVRQVHVDDGEARIWCAACFEGRRR